MTMYRGHIEVIVKQETGWVMVFNVTFSNISVISLHGKWNETQLKCTNNFYLVKLQVLIYICAVYQTKCCHVFPDRFPWQSTACHVSTVYCVPQRKPHMVCNCYWEILTTI